MQVVSSPLYARFPPFRIPPHETAAVIGQTVGLDEHARKLILQPDLDSTATLDINLPESFECSELRNARLIEVRGICESNGSITMKEYCNLKDNFDLKTYNEVLKLTNDPSFRHIFGHHRN